MAFSPLNPVIDEEIARVYEERRLIGLRELARDLNNRMKGNGIQEGVNVVNDIRILNMLITNIDQRNADYLYFAICNRTSVLEQYHDFNIPENLRYDYVYDSVFRRYALYTIEVINEENTQLFPENWIPYVMMMNPNELTYLYLTLYNFSNLVLRDRLIEIPRGTIRGTSRDVKIDQFIDLLTHSIDEISDNSDRSYTREIIIDNIIKMIRDGSFDILDTIYLLLSVPDTRDPYTDENDEYIQFRGFRNLVS